MDQATFKAAIASIRFPASGTPANSKAPPRPTPRLPPPTLPAVPLPAARPPQQRPPAAWAALVPSSLFAGQKRTAEPTNKAVYTLPKPPPPCITRSVASLPKSTRQQLQAQPTPHPPPPAATASMRDDELESYLLATLKLSETDASGKPIDEDCIVMPEEHELEEKLADATLELDEEVAAAAKAPPKPRKPKLERTRRIIGPKDKYAMPLDVGATREGDIAVNSFFDARFEEEDISIRLSLPYARDLPPHARVLCLSPRIDPGDLRLSLSAESRQARVYGIVGQVIKETLASYGSKVLDYLEWCEEENIDPRRRFPIEPVAFSHYIATKFGLLRASTIRAYISALKFWHTAHDEVFLVSQAAIRALNRQATNLEPRGKEPRRPAVIKDLVTIAEATDWNSSHDVCCLFASSALFFGMGRPGDATLRAENKFHRDYHMHGGCIRAYAESEDAPPHVELHLPFDKVEGMGGDRMYLVPQEVAGGKVCPLKLLHRHLQLSGSDPVRFLFNYMDRNGDRRNLTYGHFRDHMGKILAAAGRPPLQLHGYRIGGATFYLLSRCNPAFVKVAGRWRSDAFERYWRNHRILAAQHLADAQDFDVEGNEIPVPELVAGLGKKKKKAKTQK